MRVYWQREKFIGEYRIPSETFKTKRPLRLALCQDRTVSLKALTDLLTAERSVLNGIMVAPSSLPDLVRQRFVADLRRAGCRVAGVLAGAVRPLTDHVDDWHRSVVAGNRTARHAGESKRRAKRLFKACGFAYFVDIQASAVHEALAEMRVNGLSVAASNHYLGSAKAFCGWMVRDGRAGDNPLVHLQRGNARTDVRHDRRAFTVDELRRLLATTEVGPDHHGVTGPERALLYLFSVHTGFRASETRSLITTSLSMHPWPPTVTLEAAYSKHRRRDVQPIRDDLAQMLATHVAGRLPVAPVFKMPHPCSVVRMLRKDLKAAGIPYRDADGRFSDFHSFRHTFITMIQSATGNAAVTRDLARHSSLAMTDRYTHTVLPDVTAALDGLPTFGDEDRKAKTGG